MSMRAALQTGRAECNLPRSATIASSYDIMISANKCFPGH